MENSRPPHQVLRQEFLVAWKGHDDADNTWLSKTALGKDKDRAIFMADAGYLDEEAAVRKPR